MRLQMIKVQYTVVLLVGFHAVVESVCPTLNHPVNGDIRVEGYNVDNIASYTCNKGYVLNGSNYRKCLIDNTWSLAAPTCNDKNECLTANSCHASATCTNTAGSYTCYCSSGYTGDGFSCSDVNECTSIAKPDNCHVNADCSNTVGSFTCSCKAGYVGNGVSCTDSDECAAGSDNCHVNADCSNTVGSFTCACKAGYTGDGVSCSDVDECSQNTHDCDVNAVCINTPGSFTCNCNQGYTGDGKSCSDKDECVLGVHTCNVNAVCSNTVGSYTCSCKAGYSGDGVTCSDIDECTENPNICGTNSECQNTVGSYSCTCYTGFSFNGVSCADKDECGLGEDDCDANAVCNNNAGSYDCTCNSGYSGDGVTCSDIDECALGQYNCDGNAQCNNNPGSYTCSCNSGYSGDGVTCSDIDECTSNTHTCDTNAKCYNTDGSFSCSCKTGYSGDGVTCTDKDECGLGEDDCNANAVCNNNAGSYTCTCNSGYSGDGVTCSDKDECFLDEDSCDANAVCSNNVGSYDCTCNSGYSGDGFSCSDENECANGPCDPQATCSNFPGDYSCTCNDGYNGDGFSCSLKDCGSASVLNLSGGSVTSTINTFGSYATATCNEGYTMTGSDQILCQSDGSWGTLPTCEAIDCNTLAEPVNGQRNYVDGTTTFGSQATFSCNTGYTLEGSATSECLSTGSWSNQATTCKIVDCGALVAPQNGQVNFDAGTEYQKVASYTCNEGYNMNGNLIRFCEADGNWTGIAPTCDLYNCGALSDPANGQVNAPVTTYLSTASYTCNTGYELSHTTTRTCQDGGTWDGTEPNCTIINCNTLAEPVNGQRNYVDGTTTFGSQATFLCNTGYTLEGSATSECLSTGSWSNQATTCKIVDCGALVAPQNGQVNFDAGTEYQKVASYTCNEGYNMNGNLIRRCEADGNWTGISPTCDLYNCGALSDPANGQVNAPVTTYLSTASYTCNTGYELSHTTTRTCQDGGTWDGTEPNCTIISCGTISAPTNGDITVAAFTYDEVATFTCNTGYELKGSSSSTCQASKQWSSAAPTCQVYNCGTPTLPNGNASAADTTWGNTATYECDTGYELSGPSLRTCMEGFWGSSQPVCNIVDCGSLPEAGDYTIQYVPNKEYLSTATYSCNVGYQQTGGSTSRTCQADGSWDGTGIVCQIYTCPTLSDPANGEVTLTGTDYGDVASFTCDLGYQISGSISLTCGKGTWSDSSPTCTIRDCGSIATSIANGTVVQSGTEYGDVSNYTCISGHMISTGVVTLSINCQADGTWEQAAPSCIPADCGKLIAPENGQENTAGGTLPGNLGSYTCNLGYDLIGDNVRECLNTGLWNRSAPTCKIIECANLSDPSDGTVNVTGNSYSHKATYICNTGYKIFNGSEQRTCMLDGKWNGTEPVCVKKDCGSLATNIANLTAVQTGTQYQDTTIYTCNTGFVFSPGIVNMTVTCAANGSWTSTAPVCKPVDCGDLPAPAGGQIDYADTKYNTLAAYTCNPGHDLSGNNVRRCKETGFWEEGTPVCIIRNCSSPDQIGNGTVDANATTYGAKAVYSCNTGFKLISGSAVRYCGENRAWNGTLPVCQQYECGSAPTLQNVEVNSTNGTSFGSKIVFQCKTGFFLSSGNLTRTCRDGVWDGTSPNCSIIDCGNLTSPENGAVIVSSTTYGSQANYSCSIGYHVASGSAQRICDNSQSWSGTPAVCLIYDCGALSDPTYGTVNMTGQTYNETARYSCFLGHDLKDGDQTRTCGEGTWTGTAPTCVIKDCGALSPIVVGGSVIITGQTYGDTANYTCDIGFLIAETGLRTRLLTCGIDGRWDGNVTACNSINCGILTNVTNGKVDISSGMGYLDVATYSCDVGYQHIGDSARMCGADGNWDRHAPECVIYDCGGLDHPGNGTVFYKKTNYSATATYVCNIGYYISQGDTERSCLDGGSWNGTIPTCTLYSCGALSDPPNGKVTITGATYGDSAFYLCNTGYYRTSGNITRVCGAGTWKGTQPVCSIRSCGTLGDPAGGRVSLTGTTYGETATYTCNSGYYISRGSVVRMCRATGLWDGEKPTCSLIPLTTQPTTRGTVSDERDFRCGFRNEDLVFGIAVSSMTSESNFAVMKNMVKSSINRSNLESRDMRVGVYVFDDQGVREDSVIHLNASSSRTALIRLVDDIVYTPAGGPSYMLRGLEQVLKMFNNGNRESVPDYVFILLEDNVLLANTLSMANQIRNFGIHLDFIAVGFAIKGGLSSLTYDSYPGHVLSTESFTELDLQIQYAFFKERGCDCEGMPAPLNGRVNSTGNYYLDVASFSCFPGYTLVGIAEIVCLYGGMWSSVSPRCVSTSVTVPPIPVMNTLCGLQSLDVIVGIAISDTTSTLDFQRMKNLLKTYIDHSNIESGSTQFGYFIYGPGFAWKSVALGELDSRSELIASVDNFRYITSSLPSKLSLGLQQAYSMFMSADNRPFMPDLLYMIMDGSVDISATSSIVNRIKQAEIRLDFIAVDFTNTQDLSVLSQVTEFETFETLQLATMLSFFKNDSCSCDTLRSPTNGEVFLEGTFFLDVASFSCALGYELIGSQQLVCRDGGMWSSIPPTCVQKAALKSVAMVVTLNMTSGNLDLTDNATLNRYIQEVEQALQSHYSTAMKPDAVAISIASLKPGSLIVNLSAMIQNTEEANRQFALSSRNLAQGAVVKLFGEPLAVTRMTLDDNSEDLVSMSVDVMTCTAYIRANGPCAAGYICQLASNEPTCVPDAGTDCGLPDSLSNGMVTTEEGTTYGRNATYYCDIGFVLVGINTRTCQPNGLWIPEKPTCTIKDNFCGQLESPDHGSVTLSDLSRLGSTATYRCDTTYMPTGPTYKLCSEDQSWVPQTPTRCVTTDCGNLENPDNGAVTVSGTSYGDYATYVCDAGHQMSGTSSRMCMENGKWSGSTPSCVIRDCGSLPAPQNGMLNVSAGTTYGQLAVFSCHSQYKLVGLSALVCRSDGAWSGQPPTCQLKVGYVSENLMIWLNLSSQVGVNLKDSVILEDVKAGLLDHYSSEMGDTVLDIIVQFLRSGSLVVDYTVVMKDTNDTAKWFVLASKDLAQGSTVIMLNQILAVTRMEVGANPVNLVTMTDEDMACVLYTELVGPCQMGYICTAVDGIPSCSRDQSTDCGVPAQPANGNVDYSRGTFLGDTIIYTCNLGYTLVGHNTRTCQADGSFAPAMPSCNITDCGPLNNPINGVVLYVGTTYRDTATFTCNTGHSLIGSTVVKCQADAMWSNIPPTCSLTSCGSLSSPQYGSVTFSTTSQMAVYTCQTGYTLTGSATRTCLSSNFWSGAAPVCEVTDCGPLPDPLYGRVEYTGTAYGSKATYFCTQIGYQMSGQDVRLCDVDGSWTGKAPTCNIINCGVPSPVANGKLTLTGTTYGQTGTYVCSAGYILIGAHTLTCQISGDWSDSPPQCLATGDCGGLEVPYGTVTFSMGTSYLSQATYSCHTGYAVLGNAVRTCQSNNVWSGNPPICALVDCGPLISPLGGRVNFTSGTTYGKVARYLCLTGYNLIGPADVTCQDNGNWSHYPTCQIEDCGDLTNPKHGLVDTLAGTTFGSVAVYSCNPGYKILGASTRKCLENKVWNATAPTCIIKDCGSLSNPANGLVSFLAGSSYGQTATYACNPGYTMSGSPSRQCAEDGVWTGSAPVCEEILCGSLKAPVNGKIVLSQGLSIGSVATYSCDSGYRISSLDDATRVCQQNGTFSKFNPTCIIDCGKLTPPMFGNISIDGTTYGAIAQFTCYQGYVLSGSSIRMCGADGKWNGTQSLCNSIDCGELKDPDNGQVIISDDSGYGNIAMYKCNAEYVLQGYYKRNCLSNRTWSGVAPTCERSNEFALAVGLGAGLSGFVLLAGIIVVIVVILYRRDQSKQTLNRTYLLDYDTSPLPLKMNTRASMYIPYAGPVQYENESDTCMSSSSTTWKSKKADHAEPANAPYYSNNLPVDDHYHFYPNYRR